MDGPYLLSFTVEGIPCALPLADTRQVVGMVALSPGTGGVAGTMNLHGRPVPVYSVRRLLGLPDRPPLTTDALIIAGKDCVALWVDGVQGVRTSAEPLPEAPSSPGALLTEDGTVLIHDLPAFLAAEGSGQFAHLANRTGEEAPAHDPGRAGAILAVRARAAARPKEEVREARFSEILTFRLGGGEYAIEMQYIREVFIIREITPVPGVPDFIAGICAVRGEIISLVDLSTLFSIPKQGLTDLNRVIVLTDGTITFGILADYITDIGTRPTDRLSPVDPGTTPIGDRYLLGVADGATLVLDAAAILADPQMVIDENRN
ncbi:chemotaxis protein CheW [Methanoculleus sp.]|uniref:chemotaxis protein CheW n=1 Tax=Methanoculleus sp. TaxID=90427 RepID=UPI002FC73547